MAGRRCIASWGALVGKEDEVVEADPLEQVEGRGGARWTRWCSSALSDASEKSGEERQRRREDEGGVEGVLGVAWRPPGRGRAAVRPQPSNV